MYVSRDLNLTVPTRGVWVAKVTNNRNVVVCSNTGTALYEPKANLPLYSNFHLFGWWLAGSPEKVCKQWPLPPGEYCVQTLWEFYPRNYPVSKPVDAPEACFLFVDKPEYLR